MLNNPELIIAGKNWPVSSRELAETLNVPRAIDFIQTTSYFENSDRGGALYKRVGVDPGHSGAFQSNDGAWFDLVSDPVNPFMFGAIGDGATDDAAALNNMFAAPFSNIEFVTASYFFNTALVSSGSKIINGNNSTLVEGQNFDKALALTNFSNGIIQDFAFQGIETLAVFQANPPVAIGKRFVYVDTSNQVTVRRLSAVNKRVTVQLEACSDSLVEGISCVGFMPVPFNRANAQIVGANYCVNVFIDGGHSNQVANGYATANGSNVLIGNGSQNGVITGNKGSNFQDSGVYISSGDYWVVTGNDFYDTYVSGVIIRGSHNNVVGNNIRNAVVGVNVSGYGAPANDVNGIGSVIANNNITSCFTAAVYVLSTNTGQGVGYMQDVSIFGNVCINCPTDAGGEAISVEASSGIRVDNNLIYGAAGTNIAIDYKGISAAKPMGSGSISGNIINGSAATQNIFIDNASSLTCNNNVGANNTSRLFEIRNVVNSSFMGNICSDGVVLNIPNGNGATNNIIANNIGNMGLNQPMVDANIIYNNDNNQAWFPTITAAPKMVGLLSYDGVNAYYAKGLASVADWIKLL